MIRSFIYAILLPLVWVAIFWFWVFNRPIRNELYGRKWKREHPKEYAEYLRSKLKV